MVLGGGECGVGCWSKGREGGDWNGWGGGGGGFFGRYLVVGCEVAGLRIFCWGGGQLVFGCGV